MADQTPPFLGPHIAHRCKKSRFIDNSDSLATLITCYDAYISRFADFLWMMMTIDKLITLHVCRVIMVGHWSISEQSGDWHGQIVKCPVSGHTNDHYPTC